MGKSRDHGGGLDAAAACFGGQRADWIDLSTGINPVPYPIPALPMDCWTALPDAAAQDRLDQAARSCWRVPNDIAVLCTPGLSSAIAQIPRLATPGHVKISGPTYNEHAASFTAAGWTVVSDIEGATASVCVHPNNPDGRLSTPDDFCGALQVVDESFCDVMPNATLLAELTSNSLILKSFGKFWGLAGVRLGFVLGHQDVLDKLADMLGPWPVSGPALAIGAQALSDTNWAAQTRTRLDKDAKRLDQVMSAAGASPIGGTSLFRLYEVEDASHWQARFAANRIWTRTFPYDPRWLRLGLPHPSHWDRVENALR